jgi:hydroxymethylglutaryl-CoA synthase
MKQPPSAGLSAIAFDIPEHYIDLAELASARGVEPGKFTKGLGQLEMAVAMPTEDPVVLAIAAGKKALRGFSPEEIGLLIVGTETSVDQSKPISSFVHEHLGLPSACRNFELKHACYGAMAGITMATDWILSGRARSKKALVIASDVARYGLNTPGEPTQGAGAVAMLVSESPSLVEFQTAKQGYFSKQVMDFWRPNYSKEAFADGHYSMECYLEALGASYRMYAGNDLGFANQLQAALYHAPFVKMAQKAHVRLWELSQGVVCSPASPEFEQARKDYEKRVAPYLDINARVGNIYTGALFLSLFRFLERVENTGGLLSLFSYGSGCVAEYSTLKVIGSLAKHPSYESSEKILHGRRKLSISQYEEIMSQCSSMDSNGSKFVAAPESKRKLHYLGCQDNKRIYG